MAVKIMRRAVDLLGVGHRRDLHRFENAVPGHVDNRVAVALEKSAAALLDCREGRYALALKLGVVEARCWK